MLQISVAPTVELAEDNHVTVVIPINREEIVVNRDSQGMAHSVSWKLPSYGSSHYGQICVNFNFTGGGTLLKDLSDTAIRNALKIDNEDEHYTRVLRQAALKVSIWDRMRVSING